MSEKVAPWKLVREQPGSAGFVRITNRSYLLPNGNRSTWDILHGGRTVAVLAITADNHIITAKQYRPGPDRIMNELPGGLVEPDEDIPAAAARELREETGYVAGTLTTVGQTWLSSRDTVQRFAVLATSCTREGEPQPDAEELTEPELLDFATFLTHLRSGNLTDTDIAWMCLDALKPFELDQF